MWKRLFSQALAGFSILVLFILPAGCAGGTEVIEADLGQEFLLSIKQEASITGEKLRIRFEDVIEDSRCPLNVTCIWEGRVSILARLIYDDATYTVVLNEPGLTDYAVDVFRDYSITFHLKPYPGEMENISKEDYYLQLTISKQQSSSMGDQVEIMPP